MAHMKSHDGQITGAVLIAILLFLSSLVRSQLTPSHIGTVLTVIFAACIVGASILSHRSIRVQTPPLLVVPFGLLVTLFISHIAANNVGAASLSIWPIYTAGTAAICLFLIPQMIPHRTAYRTIAFVAAVFGIVGLITVFVMPILIGPFSIEAWPYKAAPLVPVDGALRSTFRNPNFAGILFFVGSIAAISELDRQRSVIPMAIAAICVLSLYLTQSRASMVAFVAALGIYLIHRFGTEWLTVVAIALGGVITATFVLSRINIIPPIPILETISLTNRDHIWRGAIAASRDSWLFGAGIYETGRVAAPYTHESIRGHPVHGAYFHMLVRGGILAVILFCTMVWGSILQHIAKGNVNTLLISLATGFSVLMVFENNQFFGMWTGAVLLSLTVGYLYADRSRIILLQWGPT